MSEMQNGKCKGPEMLKKSKEYEKSLQNCLVLVIFGFILGELCQWMVVSRGVT